MGVLAPSGPSAPTPVPNQGGNVIVLDGISWPTFEKLASEIGDRRSVRLTYDRGRLELMSLLPEHEAYSVQLAQFVSVCNESNPISGRLPPAAVASRNRSFSEKWPIRGEFQRPPASWRPLPPKRDGAPVFPGFFAVFAGVSRVLYLSHLAAFQMIVPFV
jgi:hypothetical protein